MNQLYGSHLVRSDAYFEKLMMDFSLKDLTVILYTKGMVTGRENQFLFDQHALQHLETIKQELEPAQSL